MRMLDVNVLVNAQRRDMEHHEPCHSTLKELIHGDEAYAVSDFVINGFMRIVTNRRIPGATTFETAREFSDTVRHQPHAVIIAPGPRHWEIFTRLCRQIGDTGNLVPDAYLAALAIEHGCEFVTCDKDFTRFEGLRCRSPLN
ncbi:type II toxin-antitoxin system VapC family toxin [Nonomuraea cavernae]|uniref:Ribonuclease VapC n=1 Tax=Nonomuraea cavernae TaxID=2045107 RepID=A0A917YRD5_9ACTN|nr:type II toxin-antitoxin system VapC family toxin [Nonomuraea cavernae]MCA2184839.1 type II toxin-antitoxin system VapC family toxin [Nonomuraea cavernae]GGO64618.1 ribonuclease VapC43 [Nonomuraea cavernae]